MKLNTITLFLACVLQCATAVAERPAQPNILLIYADDLGWQDVGCYDVDDNAIFETPYMDALAKEGVKFWQAYSPAPVCAPSRAGILTGKHPARLGITSVAGGRCPHPLNPHSRVIAPFTDMMLQSDEVTIPELLGPAGYYNGHSGKWHITGRTGFPMPKDQGFDWSKQNRGIHFAKGWDVKNRVMEFATNEPNDPYRLDKNGFAFDQNAQDALDFMAEAVDKQKPFFCYYAQYLVHTPNHVRTESLLIKYAEKMGYDYPLTGDEFFEKGQTNPFYAAMVERFDYNVHQVVSYLKETDDPRWPGHKLIENTYVIITSDNGGMEWDQENATDNYPLDQGKIHLKEGGIRVPFIVLGSSIPANVESDVMINGLDVMPTILSWAGVTIPDGLDGSDLSSLLESDPTDKTLVKEADGSVRDVMVWHFPHSVQLYTAIRKDRWKLIHNYDHRENPNLEQYNLFELYDTNGTVKDLNEAVDVSDAQPELTAELATELQARLDDMGAMPAYRNPNSTQTLTNQDIVPAVLQHGNAGGGVVWAEFETEGKAAVTEAALLYTLNGGTPREDWLRKPARLLGQGRVEADVPEGTTHYVFNLVDENDYLISYPDVGFRKDVSVQSGFTLPYSAQPIAKPIAQALNSGGIQIKVVGPQSDYAETNMSSFRSSGVPKNFDADGDYVYGTEGLFFFGISDSNTDSGFENYTKVGAEWATFSTGADASVVIEGTKWNYTVLDNPNLPPASAVADWDIKSAFIRNPNAGTVGEWDEVLKFKVDETAPEQFRLGLMAGTVDSSVFNPSGLRISFDEGSAVEINGLMTTARIGGMVFFDIDLRGKTSGTFSIEAQRSSAAQGAGLTGVTFDRITEYDTSLGKARKVEVPALNKLNHIDWPAFMSRQDMVWNQIPKRWKVIPSAEESVEFQWQPQKAASFARDVSLAAVERGKLGGGEVSHFYTTFASTPYPDAPEVEVVKSAKGNTSRQVLYGDSGELVVAWQVSEDRSDRSSTLLGSIAFSQEMGVAMPEAKRDLSRAVTEVKTNTYTKSHEQWWNEYYPRSFVSISDDFWEQFYWIQMYKIASASRADGMMLDTAGPWYQPGFHPLVWSDLNVQLCYWAQLTSNRLDVGKSLLNVMDRNIENLSKNVVPDWQDECLDADTVFPGDDLIAPIPYKKVADHVVWMLHNYWLFCEYGNDRERMRDGLFPLLKRANATYLRYIEDHPLDLGDGKLHFKHTWSPEAATGVDMNYTIALARWSSRVLLEINEEHNLNDPKASEWQNLLDNLVGWQIDENGLRLGKDYAFDHAHRHYSHLLAFFPLYDLTPDKDRELIRKSVDHWLAVTENPSKVKDSAMPVTGYTCTGAASMYASLGDGEKAFEYLKKFTFVNIFSNTLYSEGKEQLIETPMSAAAAMHDMLLQSWGGRIRIMPGVPDEWEDIHYESLLCKGGATVSADRSNGQLGFAKIESPDIARTIEFSVPIEAPQFAVMGANQQARKIEIRKNDAGFYQVELAANAALLIKSPEIDMGDITPVNSPVILKNIFGNNGQYKIVREQFKTADFREPIGITK